MMDLSRNVSRMAAVLVEAAGGEIVVPLRTMEQNQHLELHQDDSRPGYVIYRTRLGGRHAPAATPDAEFTVVSDETALPAPPRRLPAPKDEI